MAHSGYSRPARQVADGGVNLNAMRHGRRSLGLLVAAFAAGCHAERTEVVVVVSSGELQVPADLNALRLTVTDRTISSPKATRFDETVPLCAPGQRAECYPLPLVLTLIPGDQRPTDPVTVDVQALRGADQVLRNEATFTFRTGASMRLDFILYGKCVGTDCATESGSSCDATGGCSALAPTMLTGEPHLDLGAAATDGAADLPAPEEDAAGADLAGADLAGVDFAGVDLSVALDGAAPNLDLRGADLTPGPDLVPVERSCGALQIDGTNAAALVAPASAQYNPHDFTVEAWVFRTGPGQILSYADSSGQNSFSLSIDPGDSARFTVNTATTTYDLSSGLTGVPLHAWTHLAGVWDTAYLKQRLYINGLQKQNTIPNAAPRAIAGTLAIGNTDPAHSTPYPFQGVIDEVRVSSVARYSADSFTPIGRYSADANTLALFHLDEASGRLAVDASPLANHAALQGNAQFTATCAPYRCGVLSVNGGQAAATATKFSPTGSFTVEAWVILTSNSGGDYTIVEHAADGTHIGYRLNISNSVRTAGFYVSCDGTTTGSASLASGVATPLNVWTHIAGVFDGVTPKAYLFVNGTLEAQATPGCGAAYAASAPFGVAEATLHPGLPGLIDELRLSNVARYNATFTPPDGFSSDSATIALYHFNEGGGTSASDDVSGGAVPLTLSGSTVSLDPGCY
jgi:hypothetical protein